MLVKGEITVGLVAPSVPKGTTGLSSGSTPWTAPIGNASKQGRTQGYTPSSSSPNSNKPLYTETHSTPSNVNTNSSPVISPNTTTYRTGTTNFTTPTSTTLGSSEANLNSKPQWQQMLDQIQGGDKQTFLSALASAQQKWGEYNSNGDTEKANAAHTWANQLRDAAGLSGQYDQATGQMTDQGQNLFNSFQQAQPTTQDQTQQQQQQQTNPYLQMYLEKFQQQQDLMNKINSPDSDLYSSIKSTAKEQAHQQAQQQLAQFQTLMSQLQAAESRGLAGVDSSLSDAKQALEDRSFQDYLGARQDMANRGLASSGLASDQDTRLLLAKQRDLAGIERDAANNRQSVRDQFENQIADTQRQSSLVNESAMYNQLYSSLYGTTKQSMLDGAKSQFQGLEGLRQMLGDTMKNDTTLAGQRNDILKQILDNQGAANVADINGRYKEGTQTIANEGTIGAATARANATVNAAQISGAAHVQGAQIAAEASKYKSDMDVKIQGAHDSTQLGIHAAEIGQKIEALKSQRLTVQGQQKLAIAKHYSDLGKALLASAKNAKGDDQKTMIQQAQSYFLSANAATEQATVTADLGSDPSSTDPGNANFPIRE